MEKLHRQPHALLFPFPVQGHVNPMMLLARKLLSSDFFITFVNTEYNHLRLDQSGALKELEHIPNLRFEHIPDGLPLAHGRFNEDLVAINDAILSLPGPFAKLLEKIIAGTGPPITCIIADSFVSWVQDVADEFGIPRVSLWTTPVHSNLAHLLQPVLISEGYIPIHNKQDLSKIVTCLPGVKPFPLSDYISYLTVEDSSEYLFQLFLNHYMKRSEEAIWNLGNNIVELESEAVNAFKKYAGTFLPIGPLVPDALLKGGEMGAMPSLWPEERGCLEWLEEQEEGSVLYVSFGSIANIAAAELEELVIGVEESGAPFVWAARPDQGGEAMAGLRRRCGEWKGRRGLVVEWAPQVAVLGHRAVGGFLTHCGWNSVTESVSAGVPILAKSGRFAEQNLNARYITEVWEIGLLLAPPDGGPLNSSPSLLTRRLVQERIQLLLGSSPVATAIRSRLAHLRQVASTSTSHSNFRLFVDDIKRRANLA